MFDFGRVIFSPASSALSRDFLQEENRFFVPSAERFDDKRLESDPLAFALVVVIPILRRFPALYRETGLIGGPVDKSFLRWRCNADVEGHSPSVHPVGDVDVCGPGKGARDEMGSFLLRIKRRELRFLEYFVPNSVVTSTAHPLIVVAMHGVITK